MQLPIDQDEERRLRALRRYAVLDTPPDPAFDRLALLASALFDCSISLVSFVDSDRVWHKSRRGFELQEIPREASFCSRAIRSRDVLVVSEARTDERFAALPLVVNEPWIRAYLGAPITTSEGFCIGTVCVMDTSARDDFKTADTSALQRLAELALDQLEARRPRTEVRTPAELLPLEVIDRLPIPICAFDEHGRFLLANGAYCSLCGYALEELEGKSFSRLLPSEVRPWARRLFRDLLSGGRPSPVEWTLVRKDGMPVEVHVVSANLRNADGKIVRVSAVTDLTAVKSALSDVLQARKLESMRRLAGGIAHNFNNLLTVITGYAELLSVHVENDEQARADLQEIAKAAGRASEISGYLLAFSRHRVLSPELIDVNERIRATVPALQGEAGERYHIRFEESPEAGQVMAAPGQLERALRNLVTNASEAMPDGGTLTIETGRFDADEDYFRLHPQVLPGAYTTLTVTDTGTGMPPEARSHLFEPFYTTKSAGKGIGLASVYGIVKQSGGELEVKSEPGKGTSIRILIPMASAPRGAVGSSAPAEARRSGTVLLVESDEDLRRTIREMLIHRGYRVIDARDSAEALRLAARNKKELGALVTSIAPAGISGPELAKRLYLRIPDLRILFLSGYADESAAEAAARIPRARFIEKPFTSERLDARLREVLA